MDIYMLCQLVEIKSRILNVTCSLDDDSAYTKSCAVSELKEIIREMHFVEEMFLNQKEVGEGEKNNTVGQ